MSQFYLKADDVETGPFTLDELKEKGITQTTMVKHLETWARAFDFEVLSDLFKSSDAAVITDEDLHWGDFQPEHCTKRGFRQYSAILWGIPWGASWEETLLKTPAVINGIEYPPTTRYTNNGFNIWGHFDVPDAACGIPTPPTSGNKVPTCGIKFTAQSTPWNGRPKATCIINATRRLDELNAQCRDNNWRGLQAGNDVTAVVKSDLAGVWAFRNKQGAEMKLWGGAPKTFAEYNLGRDDYAGNLLFYPPNGVKSTVFRMHIEVNNEPIFFTSPTFYNLDRDGHICYEVNF